MKIDVLLSIKRDLQKNVDEKTRDNYTRFFREEVRFYGVKTGVVGKIAKKYFQGIGKNRREEIFSLCEQLLESDYCEEAFIAFEWAYWMEKDYEPSDFRVFENWIGRYVNNWAKCDTLCNHALGSFIEKFPRYIKDLKAWTKSDNRWFRRASAVTLILPARKGRFLKDVFEISDSLLKDEDDLVQKGYGWMLKEASKVHQREVFEYVMRNKKDMPRTALRYAIEKMPPDLKAKAMEK